MLDPASSPAAMLKRFDSEIGHHLFVAAGSRIFDIDVDTAHAVDRALAFDKWDALPSEIARLVDDLPPKPQPLTTAPPITALSLNIMQACNMACGYCYAGQGRFGGPARAMDKEIAFAAVDRLLESTPKGTRAVLAFMGGEPFLARGLLHDTTRYAADAAAREGRIIAFAITTNATLLTPPDVDLLSEYPFNVTVSLDGPPALQDRQRPMRSGARSWPQVQDGIAKLLARPPRQLSGRITVTAGTGPLKPVLDHVLAQGFSSAGFAPVVEAPHAGSEISGDRIAVYTSELIACGRHALLEAKAGRHYGFSNFDAAMAELHRGSARAHPCGAGAGYLSVDAGGDIFACHRLVGDQAFRFGSLDQGVDDIARHAHLTRLAVDTQEPCRSCWAKYLCGGGCYHEVSRRGRPMCDHIRAWLAFCLESYATLSEARPEMFTAFAEPLRLESQL